MTQATPAPQAAPRPLALDRASRVVVIVSVVAAIALETVLGARAWSPLRDVVAVTFVVTLLFGRIAPRVGAWIVLLPAYGSPVLLLIASNRIDPAYGAVFVAAMVGLVVGRSGFSGWALPPGWRLPLALWALSIALSWPIVVWRELDFTPALLNQYHLASTYRGGPPPVLSVWISHVAAIHLAGLLWIDGLFRAFGGRDPRLFERSVAWPLLGGALLMAGLALYQMFVDITYFNVGAFASLGRVSGAILDGNLCGMVAAIWAVGAVVLAIRSRRTPIAVACGCASALLLVTTWGSGSRTALLAVVVGSAALVGSLVWSSRRSVRALVLSAAVAVVVIGGVGAALRSRSAAVGPLSRMGEFMSDGHLNAIGDIAASLWNRNAYGQIASYMFGQFPLVGTGVGSFHALAVDYAYIVFHLPLDADNAQNWFRHQLVEFGVVGSIGWIVWVGMLFGFLFRRVPANGREIAARTVKGLVVAVGLASCLGMPTQDAQALMTFWTLVFWSVALADATGTVGPAVRQPARWWAAIFVLAAIYAACTGYVGVERLRVPFRAMRADWNYAYGFYALEQPPAGAPYWWTGRKSVAVFAAPGRYLRLAFWVNHPDVRVHPVHVKIWRTTEPIVDIDVSDTAPIVRYVRVPDGASRMMIETHVDRTWTPSAGGGRDTRELGVAIEEWSFAAQPPAGAVVVR